jgi:hypothetical protein
MLRASPGATLAGLATRGCSNRPVGKNSSPWYRAVELRSRAAAHGASWLLMALAAARACSQLAAVSCRPDPKPLGRMSASPMPRSALRGHARGRDLLRAAGHNALSGIVCASIYMYKRAARKTAGSGTSSRRHRDEVPRSLRIADGATIVPRHRHAAASKCFASALPRLCIGTVALAPRQWRHCRAGPSELSRWCMSVAGYASKQSVARQKRLDFLRIDE